MDYQEFIKSKTNRLQESGFEIKRNQLNSNLKDFQAYIIQKALKRGRSAIFADCGLGKTLMQLEWAAKIRDKEQCKVLILTPLAVRQQTQKETEKFGIDPTGIDIVNYEQLDNVNIDEYSAVVLDESSILKNFEGKFRNKIVNSFAGFRYKLACTATPSPNDVMELGNHAEFLDVMKRTEMLAMYFVHDGGDTSKWRLKGHAKDEFWRFVSSWATMINKPSDLGFDDTGFILPGLNYIEHPVKIDNLNKSLLDQTRVNATNYNQELKNSLEKRMNKACEIANSSNEQFIIWINQNTEGDYLKKQIPDAIEVRGNEKPEAKEEKLSGFARNEYRVLITKKKIAQFGLNFQNCANQIHASLDFSFESFYQAVRRSYRFMQQNEVNIYLITTNTMHNVKESLWQKQRQFEEMQRNMASYSSDFINNKQSNYKETMKQGNSYTMYQGDCVEQCQKIEENSVDLSIFSPPFSELYVYNDNERDMGNSKDYDEFEQHFKFLIPELKRVVKPGRLVVVHCMDLPIQKGKEGYIGLRDFSGMLVKMFSEQGFIYHSRVTIWKNPVTEMTRTKSLGLLHKQLKKDASMSRVGIPDYLLVFRNEGDNEVPITHQDQDPTKANYLPVDTWQKYASPVWMDINYSETLNTGEGKNGSDEKHIAPLQLQTVERALHLWSNEGEAVLDPFMGIGTVGFQAIKCNRNAIGIELKESYYNTAIKNLERANEKEKQMTLF